MVDINYKVAYEEIIKNLQDCNCEEDFKEFIVKNERLYDCREEFNWLLNWEKNPILKLNRECYFDDFLHKSIIDNQKNHKEYYNYENNFKKTFYTKFIKNIKKEFLFDKYNLLCLEQIYKDFTEIRYENDEFNRRQNWSAQNEVYPNIDSKIDYNTILNKDNKAFFLKKYEEVSNNKRYKEIFDRIPNIKKNEILRIIYEIHYSIIELLKVEGLKINKIVIFKDFIFEKYVIDYLLQYDEIYKELEKKFLNCFLLNLSNEWNKDRKSLEETITEQKETITEQKETIKEQKENINKKESVEDISRKVKDITASNLKKYKSGGWKDWNYWFLAFSIVVSIFLPAYFGWDVISHKEFNNTVMETTNKNNTEIKNIKIENKDGREINNKSDIGNANRDGVENVYPLWVKLVLLLKLWVPIFIVGLIAYRNINRNRFLKEEYQHKDTIMGLFKVFKDDDEVKDEIKKTMLEMIKENPNDKILRNENYHNRWLKKFIKNSQELLKIYKKNKNGNGKD